VTKQEFIASVAQRSGLASRDAQKAVDAFLDTITDTLRSGGDVNFTGFGKFSAAARAARQGVNPRTGERVQIAATTVPKFSAGSQLKAALKASHSG
jgi:DNA-binding protein HU-beta